MKLRQPLKNPFITQAFGVPNPMYLNMGMKGHNGLDYFAKHGEPIYACHDGYAYYQIDTGGGHGVVIRSTEKIDGKLFKTIYWHLPDPTKEPLLSSPITETDPNGKGQFVKRGDLIGYADNTGLSTGDHLHFGMKFITEGENGGAFYNLNQNNGYYGAVDPVPYMNLFISDMYYGIANSDVYNLQKILVELKFGSFIPTGFFGTKTKQAVVAFQKAHNLPQTGYCGQMTRAVLNQI